MTAKFFGTDGIRGRVGQSHITPEFMLKLGWAIGKTFASGPGKKVIIGKDTRISGYMLESALESGLSAAGVDICLLGPMPTPAVAYLTQTLRASAGLVISASHNPFEDNGIKFFSAEGSKLPDSVEAEIEAFIEKPLEIVSSVKLGKVRRINDAPGRYIEFCKSSIPSLTRLCGLKIVVDCANGATYHIAPNVFSELGADVITLADKPDGFNINRHCGSTAPEALRQKVLECQADVGVALDGDGDRLIMVDAAGKVVDGDQIIYIIAKDRHNRGMLHGGVAGTLMSNFGLELALNQLNLPFARSNVGDRYVLELLKEKQWKIGGEPSGHVVCLDKTTTGDGIIAALQVMACMVREHKSLEALLEGIQLFPQILLNIKTDQAIQLAGNSQVQSMVDKLSSKLHNTGRVLLRPSGTEPLLRLMVEGQDSGLVHECAQKLHDDILQIARDVQHEK